MEPNLKSNEPLLDSVRLAWTVDEFVLGLRVPESRPVARAPHERKD